MPIPPAVLDHRENRRDDEYTDFASLRAQKLVRNKLGRITRIDEPQNEFSALDRDRLFQAHCAFAKTTSDEKARRAAALEPEEVE